MNMDKWATLKSIQLSIKVWVKLFLLLENALKLTENLNPFQGPSLTPSSINTHRTGQKLVWINMACIELYDTGQNSVTQKSKDLATRGFQKKF